MPTLAGPNAKKYLVKCGCIASLTAGWLTLLGSSTSAQVTPPGRVSTTPDNQILVELASEDTTPANLFDLNEMTLAYRYDDAANRFDTMAEITAATAIAKEDGRRIDLMVVYTPAARADVGSQEAIEAGIARRVADTNEALRLSGVATRIHLVHTAEIDYHPVPRAGETRVRLARPGDGYMDEVHDLRDHYAADLVALIADRRFDTCGEAERSELWPTMLYSAFTVSKTFCNSDRFIPAFEHELGHSMGLSHDRYSEIRVCCDSLNKPTGYSHGYVNQRAFEPGAPEHSRWVTIMAYESQCDDAGFRCSHIPRFSNPRLTFRGDPLGIAGDEVTQEVVGPANAARALNEHAQIVANWRVGPPRVGPPRGGFTDHILPGVPIKAIHFEELRARIAALRMREGLPSVPWTDPVLAAGVPVRGVHMSELRAALNAVYLEVGWQAPIYTGGAAIRAVHVTELRDAILTLE